MFLPLLGPSGTGPERRLRPSGLRGEGALFEHGHRKPFDTPDTIKGEETPRPGHAGPSLFDTRDVLKSEPNPHPPNTLRKFAGGGGIRAGFGYDEQHVHADRSRL